MVGIPPCYASQVCTMVGIPPYYASLVYYGGYTPSLPCTLLYHPGYTTILPPSAACPLYRYPVYTAGRDEALGSEKEKLLGEREDSAQRGLFL